MVENAIINEVVMYVKGWHNIKMDKGKGAEHLKYHLKNGSNGEISLEELLNLGINLRKYTEVFKEPLMESNGSIIYEWQDNNEVRFRVVIDKIKIKDVQKNEGEGHSSTPLSSPGKSIITFYSDRNLNARMVFKNPAVREFYESKKLDDVEIEQADL